MFIFQMEEQIALGFVFTEVFKCRCFGVFFPSSEVTLLCQGYNVPIKQQG